MLAYVTKTDVGIGRVNNEDLCVAWPELNLWVLADGVGGADAGEVASKLVCETIMADIAAGQSVEAAINAAHFAVKASPVAGLGQVGMAATVVVLLVDGNHFQLSWVGDSRAYSWHPQSGLQQLTHDHSLVQQLLDDGVISAEEAINHPQRNLILQAIGQRDLESLEVGTMRRAIVAGEKLLLCSDGLTDYVADKVIGDIFSQANDETDVVEQLVAQALANGGQDNVTVLIVNLSSSSKQTTQGMKTKVISAGVRRVRWRRKTPWLVLLIAALVVTMIWAFG